MPGPKTRSSILVMYYHRFLRDGDTSRFMLALRRRFTAATVARLLAIGNIPTKRAAAAAMGWIGDTSAVPILGPLLRSNDRRLRTNVDEALMMIASSQGSVEQQRLLMDLIHENERGNHPRALALANAMLERFGDSAEVYHQRSMAAYQTGRLKEAMADCRKCLRINSYHYAAMVGLGFCHLERGDSLSAIHWFRQALEVFPDLEPIRAQIAKMERTILEDGADFDGSESA